MLFPVYSTAAEDYPTDKTTSESLNTDARVWIKPTLSVAVSPQVNIDITPRSDGAFQTGTTSLNIATNSRNGFKIFLNGADTTALTSSNGQNTIPSLTASATPDSFLPNSWGYNISTHTVDNSSTYHPIPDTATTIVDTSTSNATNSYNLTFGVKADTSLPSGDYTNTVVISVVANPNEAIDLNDLTYMQDMRTEYCTATTEETSKVLTDYRDGKRYSVFRAKDGACWMQSNLALSLSTDMVLTPNDSDVLANWSPTSNTRTALSTNNDPNGQESWTYNNDNYYYQFNAATAGTGSTTTEANTSAPSSICPRGWKLPLGGNDATLNGSFAKLKLTYGSPNANFFVAAPFYMARNGIIRSGKHIGQGGDGVFTSSTVPNATQNYGLDLGSTGVTTATQYNRQDGLNIRCVVR